MAERRSNDEYTEAETARRRDAVLKRMLNTKPQPKQAKPAAGTAKPGRKRASEKRG